MDKSFTLNALITLSSFIISDLAYAQTSSTLSAKFIPCYSDISIRMWSGAKDQCAGMKCTIPAAFFTTDQCQTYTRAPMPLRFTGADTYHNVHIYQCYEKHCIAGGEASPGSNQFIPLTYFSDNQGKSWELSSQQPEPITSNSLSDKILDINCNSSGMLCEAKGINQNKIKAKWISQDGGDTWMKIASNK